MNLKQSIATLERLITAASLEQFSDELIQNARAALDNLRTFTEKVTCEYCGTTWNAFFYPPEHWRDCEKHPARAALEQMTTARDLWQRRANAQLDITRTAVAIVAAPYQILGNRGLPGYLISKQEFEDLQRAVEAYKKLAEQETASATPTE